jgi:hypothetical protein
VGVPFLMAVVAVAGSLNPAVGYCDGNLAVRNYGAVIASPAGE